MTTQDLKQVPDEKVEERIDELNKKSDKTPEETAELDTLKGERKTRYQKKIDKMTWEKKTAEEKAERLEQELEEERKKNKTAPPRETPLVKDELIEIDGKKYYTDEALSAMVTSGELTNEQAYTHQAQRNKAQIKAELRAEIKQDEEKGKQGEIRKSDAEKVKKEYPNFIKKLPDGSLNPDFTPEDPLYIKAQELFQEVYYMRPDGLSKSIERAKEMLKQGVRADRTEDLSLDRQETPPAGGERKKEVSLSEAEKDNAIRQWCRGDVINPKTNKAYTETEACAKALQAKKNRLGK